MVGTNKFQQAFISLKSLQASSPTSTLESANLLNPSHQIPPETLTCIFSYTLQSGGRTERTGFLATEPLEQCKAIAALTRVCRYWRTTLLSNPMFWTSANLTHPSMADALLERSGCLPITAAFISPDPIAPVPSTRVLLPHFPRIQKVHVNASTEQLIELMSNLRGRSSILEAVELQRGFVDWEEDDEGGVENDPDMWGEIYGLPPMFRDVPSLKFLRVSGLPFPHFFLELTHLTHLELSCSGAPCKDYLALLSANPMLEVVIIRGTRSYIEGFIPVRENSISLPQLQRMELYNMFVFGIIWWLAFPPGAHLSACEHDLPPLDDLPNSSTIAKLQFMFSKRRKHIIRSIYGYGPNGTFMGSDTPHQLNLCGPKTLMDSVEELSISFTDAATEGSPALSFVDVHGYLLESIFSSFNRLRTLILKQVDGGEVILRLLCDPHICPELHTVVLAKVRFHTTYWSSLVEMARARDHHAGSSNIHRVDIGCHPEESPEPDQLVELRTHVAFLEVKPWDYEVEELDWLNDPRFRNLHRL